MFSRVRNFRRGRERRGDSISKKVPSTDVSFKLISVILENDNGKMEENIEIGKKEKRKKEIVQFASACFKAILFRGGTCFFSR